MSFAGKGELVPLGGGDAIPLIRDTLTVGRRESCDVCLRFPNVSSVHCELSYRAGYWYIRDLNSTNGIKVNGVRVQKKLLHPEDEVSIASRRFKIQYQIAGDPKPLEEFEEDVLGQSLLEKAGLVNPRQDKRPTRGHKLDKFLAPDDDDESDD